MHIDFFKPEQLESVADLFHEMSAHYNGVNASERSVVRKHLIENILGQHSGVRLIVAADEGRAIGLASVAILYPAPKEHGQLFMKELFVASGARHRGIGTQLIRFVARYAVANKCVRFDWTVDRDNHRALTFYRRMGARPADKVYLRVSGEDLERLASDGLDVFTVG